MLQDMELNHENLLDRVEEHRVRNGLSHREMADLVGVSPGYWSKYRRGLTYPTGKGRYGLSPATVVRIAELLDVDPLTLYRERSRPRAS